MKLRYRSTKSKEKFADSLMSIGNAIHSAVMISVLVFPLTSFIAAVVAGSEIYSVMAILQRWGWRNVGWFGIVYLVPILFGIYAKEQAMNLYDEISKNAASDVQ